MIVEYHCPETLQAALELLSRKSPRTLPLGGGTHLSHYHGDPIAVVDLRKLALAKTEHTDNYLKIGAMATLQELEDSEETPQAFKETVRFESNYNLRQAATAAGSLVSGDGKSAFVSALLALDAFITLQPGERRVAVGQWLGSGFTGKEGFLITSLMIPVEASLKYQFIGRSPMDKPIVSVAIGEWRTGRTRIVIGGFGPHPVLAMDGTDLEKAESFIINACSQVSNKINHKFIQEISIILAFRLLEK
jgi:CO/xanthine dehydrogenase FAD-binding subunit